MELILFYVAGTVALIATVLAVTRSNAAHGLIYLIVSLLAVAVIFFVLGAPFAAALEVVIYAGAIMVLFVFVVMMLNLGQRRAAAERAWLAPRNWIGPSLLALVLLLELTYIIFTSSAVSAGQVVGPKEVGLALFGPYLLAVELAALLLLAALVGAYHLGRRYMPSRRRGEETP
ncbi:MAG: NADH-quinone oxidoreductase subunit J [Gammaproteobacteria bacterium]|nr:NADH-quinone oxidoreductase subunit J [Gammaproteobacteria bacterium]